MDDKMIQEQCERFLKELGIPGFVTFCWQKGEKEFGIVSSYSKMPKTMAVKAMTTALYDLTKKAL